MTHDSSIKGQPFLFDTNFFDPDDPRYTPDPSERPKLEFTQGQLAQAKEAAFEAGKIAGLKESQSSLMQEIQNILQKISRDMAMLFAAEDHRATLYEAEAVNLTLTILKKVFPVYIDKIGNNEIQDILQKTLTEYRGKSSIMLEIPPALHDGLSEMLTKFAPTIQDRVSVQENTSLGKQGCRILWENGGVSYDISSITEKILTLLQESLAVYGINGHDNSCVAAQSNQSENT